MDASIKLLSNCIYVKRNFKNCFEDMSFRLLVFLICLIVLSDSVLHVYWTEMVR